VNGKSPWNFALSRAFDVSEGDLPLALIGVSGLQSWFLGLRLLEKIPENFLDKR
jgi:hypothetical protein